MEKFRKELAEDWPLVVLGLLWGIAIVCLI